MRTNTWLGLILLGQQVDSLQRTMDAKRQREQRGQIAAEEREQRNRIAAEQAARDRVRDEKFDSAMSGLHRGQFAMWIQTPDGERFEVWAQHALQASQALDDRQDAWELAWSDVARREEERAQGQAQEQADRQRQTEQEQYVSERFVPAVRRNLAQYLLVTKAAAAVSLIAFVFLAVLVALNMDRGDISGTPLHGAVLLLLLLGMAAGSVAIIFAMRWYAAPKDPDGDDRRRRQALEQEFLNTHHAYTPAAKRFSPPSWHETGDSASLRAVSLQLGTTAAEAHKVFPRRDQLVPLAGAYRTRTDLDPAKLPADATRLLDAFREQDIERLEALRTAELS